MASRSKPYTPCYTGMKAPAGKKSTKAAANSASAAAPAPASEGYHTKTSTTPATAQQMATGAFKDLFTSKKYAAGSVRSALASSSGAKTSDYVMVVSPTSLKILAGDFPLEDAAAAGKSIIFHPGQIYQIDKTGRWDLLGEKTEDEKRTYAQVKKRFEVGTVSAEPTTDAKSAHHRGTKAPATGAGNSRYPSSYSSTGPMTTSYSPAGAAAAADDDDDDDAAAAAADGDMAGDTFEYDTGARKAKK